MNRAFTTPHRLLRPSLVKQIGSYDARDEVRDQQRALLLALLLYTTLSGVEVECTVCITYRGRTDCRVAAGPTRETALDSATRPLVSQRFWESLLAAPSEQAMRSLVQERAEAIAAARRLEPSKHAGLRPMSREQHRSETGYPTPADALEFERRKAYGYRLNIAAGTAVRFEPGQTRTVELVALAGARKVYGFAGKVMGKLK